MLWRTTELVDAVYDGLRAFEAEASRLNEVDGLDALAETALHPLLAATLRDAGLGVCREVEYPNEEQALRLKRSERLRCDLVLTPSPDLGLMPRLAGAKPVKKPRNADRTMPLFPDSGGRASSPSAEEPFGADPAPQERASTPLADAFWLEVKVVGQFCFNRGVPGPNRAYSSELTRALTVDLPKLSGAASLLFRGLMLILFTETAEVAEHDVAIATRRAIEQGAAPRFPEIRRFAIRDRIGNRTCSIVLFPV